MDLFEPISAETIFTTLQNQTYGLETLSNQMLQSGIEKYQKKDYEGAAKEFEKSINLAPFSQYSPDTTKYLVQAYLKLDEKEKAFETYENAVKRYTDRDDLRIDLGNLYFAENRFEDAVTQYKEAVRINPSVKNRFSLGQGYMKVEKFDEAYTQFNEVRRVEPDDPNAYYGMGQLLAKTGDHDEAIEQFEKVLKLDREFYDAYAQIGYVYADMGNMDDANEYVEILEKKDEDLSQTLKSYIDKVDTPKIAFAYASGSFSYNMSKGTPVSALDTYLENANAEKSMNMKFMFSKEMDRASVENIANWSITRADGYGMYAYNFGDTIPETETTIDIIPDYVLYDKDNMSATMGFTLRQNANADATIDPSHIVFKFQGEDIYGSKMDEDHDEFSGFSRIA